MSEAPPEPVRRDLRASLAPESIAVSLIVVLVLLSLAIATSGVLGSGTNGPGASDPAGPIATGTPATSPSDGILPWAATARTVVIAESRVRALREELRTELATKPTRADDLARSIRAMNVALGSAARALDGAAQAGLPADIVADLAAVHAAALGHGDETLGASIQNVPAYTAGATTIVADLAGLEALVDRVAAASDLPVPAFPPGS